MFLVSFAYFFWVPPESRNKKEDQTAPATVTDELRCVAQPDVMCNVCLKKSEHGMRARIRFQLDSYMEWSIADLRWFCHG